MMRSDLAVTAKGSMEVSRQVHVVSKVGVELYQRISNVLRYLTLKLPLRTTHNFNKVISMKNVYNKEDRTIKELTQLFSQNNIDFFVKKVDGQVATIHFIVKPDE
jgi:hypothetical protein